MRPDPIHTWHLFLDRVSTFSTRCRDALSDLWHRWDDGQRVIAGVGCLFAAAIAAIIWFAYTTTMQRMAAEQRRIDVRCLAVNVYHEARGEPGTGQVAVAEVTMNRVASPQFPDSVCGVVHQEAAFSWTMGDASLPSGRAWQRALEVAANVHDGEHSPVVPGALHYHARGIEPAWARANEPIKTIGRHVFYP